MRRGLAADALLDGIEFTNSPQRLSRNGRAICLEEFVEVAARMRPTSGQDDIAACLQPLEAGVTVDVQNAGELFQMRRRPFGLAIGREHIDRGGRPGSAPRALIGWVPPKA